MFSTNRGTQIVPVLLNNKAVTGQDGTFASASIDGETNELILKVVNTSDIEQASEFVVDGVKKLQRSGTLTVLRSDNLNQENSFENPNAVSPAQTQIQVKDKKIKLSLQPYSVNVIRVKLS